VEIYTRRGSNSDTYSEYVIKGGDGNAPNAVLVTEIRRGSDATSPVLELVSNNVVVKLNGDTNSRTVYYRITKIGRWLAA
jgi:hypothetical protein